jgi:hypothetical protein
MPSIEDRTIWHQYVGTSPSHHSHRICGATKTYSLQDGGGPEEEQRDVLLVMMTRKKKSIISSSALFELASPVAKGSA